MLSLPGGVLHEDDHVVRSGEPGAHPDTLAHVGVAVLLLLAQVEVGAGGEVGAHMVLGHSQSSPDQRFLSRQDYYYLGNFL